MNLRLKDGDAERNPLSLNRLWRTDVCSIFGFINIVEFKIVPIDFPLKSVTRPPLITIAGGVGKP